MSAFTNRILLITGGTGSFGRAVLERFLTTDIREIRIFSRDEIELFTYSWCGTHLFPLDGQVHSSRH